MPKLWKRGCGRVVAASALLTSLACGPSPKAPPDTAALATPDPRTPVVLPADAQQAVLREMRQLLGAVGGAMSGAARGDTGAVLAALAPAGSAAAADPAIEALLPEQWKRLAEGTHGGVDALAAAVRRTRGSAELKDTVLAGIAHISGSCTSCHETFRITVR